MEAYESLRRIRKALLADLSSLVRTARKFQENVSGHPMEDEGDNIIDELLLKAFQIVNRGVRFLDIWNEEVGLPRTIAELEQQQVALDDIPRTPGYQSFSMSPHSSDAGAYRNDSGILSPGQLNMSQTSI